MCLSGQNAIKIDGRLREPEGFGVNMYVAHIHPKSFRLEDNFVECRLLGSLLCDPHTAACKFYLNFKDK